MATVKKQRRKTTHISLNTFNTSKRNVWNSKSRHAFKI